MATFIAGLHLLALPLGFSGILIRWRSLKFPHAENSLKSIYAGDNLWGLAALVWISTGLFRAFGGIEKGSDFYLGSPWFHAKMSLFALVFVLEIKPMITLIRWRIQRKVAFSTEDSATLKTMVRLSGLECLLILTIAILAVAMARNGF